MFKQRNRQHHSITYRTPFPPKSKSEQSPHKHFSSVSHLSNIESMEDLWNKFNISPGGGIHEGDKDLDQDLPTKSKCKSKYVINTEEEREKREELDLLKAEMGRRIVLKHPIGPEKVKETMRDLGWGCSRNAITVVPNIRSQTLQVPSNTHKYKYKEKINSNSNSNSNSTNSRRVEHKVREIREDIEKKGEEMKEMREKKREERRVDINKLRDKLLATKSFLRPEQSKWDIRSQKTLSFMSGKENGHDGHGSKHESTNISPNIPNIPNIISNLPESPPINEPKKFLQRIDPPLPLSPKRSSFIRAPPSTTTPREPIYTTPTPHTNTYIPTPTAPPTPINNNSSHLFLIFSTQSKIQSRVEEAREALAIRNDFNLLQAFRDMAPGGYKDLLTLFDLERALKAIGVYSNGWDLGVLIYRYTKRGRDKGVIAYPQFCRLFVPKNDELAKVMGTRITKNTNKVYIIYII